MFFEFMNADSKQKLGNNFDHFLFYSKSFRCICSKKSQSKVKMIESLFGLFKISSVYYLKHL